MPKAVPAWLTSLLQILDQLLQSLIGQQNEARKRGAAAGCPDDQNPECLTLCAAIKSAEATKLTMQAHAALCCNDPTPPPA